MNKPDITHDIREINDADQRVLRAQIERVLEDNHIFGFQLNFSTVATAGSNGTTYTRITISLPYTNYLNQLFQNFFQMGRLLDPILRDADTMSDFKHANALP